MMEHPLYVARTEAKLSQAELARRIGRSRSAICRIEKGERGSLTTFRAIGRVLGVDYRLLMPEEPQQ